MRVYDIGSQIRCCNERVSSYSHRWVMANKGLDDKPQFRARWVAQEFRGWGGDRHEYFSESADLALVKAATAHAGRRAGRRLSASVLLR